MQIYVDGKLEATHTPSSGDLRTFEAMEMWIGCGIDKAGGTFYTGIIDDFRIWSSAWIYGFYCRTPFSQTFC